MKKPQLFELIVARSFQQESNDQLAGLLRVSKELGKTDHLLVPAVAGIYILPDIRKAGYI